MKWIKEESVVKFLYWYSPVLSGSFITLHMFESFVVYYDNPMLFYCSFCAKSPFPPELVDDVVIFKIFLILFITPSLIAEMCTHVAVFVKQTRIENRATVYIVKNDQRVSRQRHHRNVISAAGHFASFAVSMVETFLLIHAFYFMADMEKVKVVRNVNMFLIPSINFFLYPLIETVFSESLRESFSVFPRTS